MHRSLKFGGPDFAVGAFFRVDALRRVSPACACGGGTGEYLGWSMKPNAAPTKGRLRMERAINAKIRHYQRCQPLFRFLDREVYDAGRDIFSDDAALAEWLCEPARALGYKVPLQVMRTARGRRQALQCLLAIGGGGYL